MKELWLTYTAVSGDKRRVSVDRGGFTVGRHSANDLSIADGRLSREHIRIERIGDTFTVTDLGSSNGTRVNGDELLGPLVLQAGDELDLGGLKMRVELSGPAADAGSDAPAAAEAGDPLAPEPLQAGSSAAALPAPSTGAKRSGIPMLALVLIPMFAIVILLFAGVLIYVAMNRGGGGGGKGGDIVIDQQDEIDDRGDIGDGPEKGPGKATPQQPGSGPQSNPPGGTNDPGGTPLPPSETAAIEEAGAKFLRRIAQNDPKAFLTLEQAKRVDARVKQLKGSSGLAENIGSARKNAKVIAELAAASNLQPQMLAVAAIAKLGSGRGDVVAAARTMAPVLGKLAPHIGSERADDTLLMIAAYDQGAAGDTMKLRNMLQDMANKNPESTREIRSIWFLEKESRITKDEFGRALTFLAIGVITQNPKAFGVNAEALEL